MNAKLSPPFLGFVFHLRQYGIAAGVDQVLDFLRGLERGHGAHLDQLFLLGRLCFVKHVSLFDAYERAFLYYFKGIDLPSVEEGDPALFESKQFRQWLAEAVQKGDIPKHAFWSMTRDELMKRFWDRVREQMEAHHGGNHWIGTGGNSPFGHSGHATGGIRVHGESRNRAANKVMGDRRFVDYSGEHGLQGDNIRQVLASLKHMVPLGPHSELDLDETIRKTGKNGGEIDLVFQRRELDRIKLAVLFDNGGSSMWPYVQVCELLFSKIKNRFQDYRAFYFHNTVYNHLFSDPQRRKPVPVSQFLAMPPDTRVFIVGDASMGPQELVSAYGSLAFESEDAVPSITRLESIRGRFPFSVWLNPIPKGNWTEAYGAWTIGQIARVFYMEDLSLRGIKAAADYLQNQARSPA